jgi:hypothetical protein
MSVNKSSKSSISWNIMPFIPLKVKLATCFHAGFLLGISFDNENGGDIFLRNVGRLPADYTALYPRRWNSSQTGIVHTALISVYIFACLLFGRGSCSCSRHYATSRKVTGSTPDEVIGLFYWPNPSNRTTALGSIQPLTEMDMRKLPGGKGRTARKADNFTAICKPIV